MLALLSNCVLRFNNSVLLFYGGVEHNPYVCIHEKKVNTNMSILFIKLETSICIVKKAWAD